MDKIDNIDQQYDSVDANKWIKNSLTKEIKDIKNRCTQEGIDFSMYQIRSFRDITDYGHFDVKGTFVRITDILEISDYSDENFTLIKHAVFNLGKSLIQFCKSFKLHLPGKKPVFLSKHHPYMLIEEPLLLLNMAIENGHFKDGFETIFKQCTEEKIFAIMAIMMIGYLKNTSFFSPFPNADVFYATAAIESICIAESYKNIQHYKKLAQSTDGIISAYKRQAASNAGKAKKSPYEKVGTKEAMKKYWLQAKDGFIQRGAKQKFIDDMHEKALTNILPMPKDANLTDKTIRNWIKDFEQEMGKSSS
ncbi:hypothetical protein [Snodgrassella gandavensis]|uniref:hypothetical protein n=1 Tax=Snodgrassella gandavensis TaxID=2946698 RepID=UPI001EF41DC9|nr:hypothetical protein [Snodgrassella gandavensis]